MHLDHLTPSAARVCGWALLSEHREEGEVNIVLKPLVGPLYAPKSSY